MLLSFTKALPKPHAFACQTRTFINLTGTASPKDVQHYVLKKRIRGTPQEVYEVVSEVSKYSEFIPYCTESFVNFRDENNKPREAGLRVGFQQYDEKFVCKVECKELSDLVKTVSADTLSHNLFHVLNSKWIITAHPGRPDCTEVELLLNFHFKSRLYASVASLFARSVTELILKAFDRRVYHMKKNGYIASKSIK
ncbi:unnamed protein product [Kluyveromyces dobzhanskii CBS 2104]|uniref:WGS project CCBQ000000000 data, contig 00099 n=1 Tax=Kluyveromyces dobzhanskii CBS 2104 TaxID=1427455 RepID=A0A0A8L1R0_9SACH|nr:unnamed protein product [Kluyveromyces dobzhanskii CBS 2104]